MAFIVPPGGLAGFSQMTPASKRSLFPGGGGRRSGASRKRRRKTHKSAATRGMAAVRTKRIRGRGKSPYTRRLKAKRRKGPKFGSPAFNKKHGVGQFRK